MFISIKDQSNDFQNEQVPESSPPWVWVGFLFVIAFLTLEVALAFTPMDEGSVSLELQLIALAGWIYWLVCIYRIHKILNQLSHHYPYSPGEAVGKHFIPLYNLYWIFEWPSKLSRYINNRGRVRMIPGGVIGTMILSGMLLRLFDGAIGLAILFGVTMYISITLKRHVAAVKGISPDQLPPLPDPKIFSRPLESSTVMTQEIVGGSEPVKPA